jgi:[ribosomal protein S5]-alanine N-acetyltransferase
MEVEVDAASPISYGPGFMQIPTVNTERLTLRAPEAGDFPLYRGFYADASASRLYGGPLSAELAWRKLSHDIGHWALRGFGMWTLVDRESGRGVGGCGIVWPEGWPRHELTWWIVPAARRRGYALEASRAAIDWAGESLGWNGVETHMDDGNSAARALAERLDGQVIARERFPDGLSRNIYLLPLACSAKMRATMR